ncbi:MAG: methylated-DNA--[protein]-cysteine S-methyltransferase [Eubacteriales bacterium]|nr:methylated-DNA--[protein]-cysteine S-methyltransferase [Eubacteriales bacterium]
MRGYITFYDSPMGCITLASDGKSITGLWFEGQKYYGNGLSKECLKEELPVFLEAKRWLTRYFRGEDPGEIPPVRAKGTSFQETVWKLLKKIPYGKTITYGELAKQLAHLRGLDHMSAQAVGQAVGHNPIGILVPCHRVVGAKGKLTGYAGGIEKKERLLIIEGFCVEDGQIKYRPVCGKGI